MRIISWNCNMALGRKLGAIRALEPDILITQECSERDLTACGAQATYWVGQNTHKGLGVAIFGDHQSSLDECAGSEWPWFLPVTIDDGALRVLAIWSCVVSYRWRYVRVSHRIIDHCAKFLNGSAAIAAGDFNSNAIWDDEHADLSHSKLVDRFGDLGMVSAYHALSGDAQGGEMLPTQFQYRHLDKAYHLDYAFISESLIEGAALTVGAASDWLGMSDHMPLVLDVSPTWAVG